MSTDGRSTKHVKCVIKVVPEISVFYSTLRSILVKINTETILKVCVIEDDHNNNDDGRLTRKMMPLLTE